MTRNQDEENIRRDSEFDIHAIQTIFYQKRKKKQKIIQQLMKASIMEKSKSPFSHFVSFTRIGDNSTYDEIFFTVLHLNDI
ncbi:hypothetical protein V1478_005166 [Vespula squamosa]|uniref:Uncharacterized protein n=1 Tax=Vespula squamosa TaxID=30214 RepID=A0ABD2BDC5_VESSQ